MKSVRRSLIALAAICVAGSSAFAQPSATPPGAKPEPDKAKAEPKPDFPPFDDVMKDFAEVPTSEAPFFSLWHNKKSDSLRAVIPASLIGSKSQFLVATSIAGGAVATGFQLDHFLAYFDRMDKMLVLMRVDPRYVEGSNEVTDVIKRSYGGDEIVKTIPIVTLRGADCVIDLDALFKGDFGGIGGWGGGTVNPALSKWVKFKPLPQNVELEVDLAMMRRDGGRRNLFHYSISKIPESAAAYKPRVADPRVGYFMTVRKDWTKPHDAKSLFNRYINRWHLEKRDPSAELSAPKNPIVWHIEKTVPLRYRRWVKEGILEWNKAFQDCGFLDAIEVKQQEDYDTATKDLDPEDVRYNFFRWIVTGRAFAMGPSRDHPLTGQIFDADIVFDDSMARAYVSSYQRLSGGDTSWRPFEPIVEQFYKSNPQWLYRSPIEKLLPNVKLREDPDEKFRSHLMEHMFKRGRPVCECASGMAYQLEFAGIALEAKGLGRTDEDFIGQIIKEIVMHEVGHCLGLRHNFKASAWLPMKEIEEHSAAGEANVGSVMDYNPAIVAVRGKKQPSFVTRTIGPYDHWAIEYGYRPVAAPYKSEDEMLAKITSRVAEPGLDYGTDEDTMSFISPDPYSNRYDMGRDVMEYANWQMALTNNLMSDITDWAVKDNESYSRLRRAFARILAEKANVSSYVARFVGGQVINRDRKGDPKSRKPIEVIDGAKQREALEFVCKHVFAEDAYSFSPETLSLLGPGRESHWGSDDFDFMVEFNIHDVVAGNQYGILMTLMNPFTVNRVHDNQVKYSEDQEVYTLAEHLTRLTDAIWSEIDDSTREGTDRKPYVNSFRRNLQRNHLEMLMNLILTDPDGTVPPDANAIARRCVSKLSDRLGKALKSASLDATSEAHLADVKKRIDKALEAQYTVGGMRFSDFLFFFQEAMKLQQERPVTVLPE